LPKFRFSLKGRQIEAVQNVQEKSLGQQMWFPWELFMYKSKFLPDHVMNTYIYIYIYIQREDVQHHSLLTSALRTGERSNLHPGPFSAGKNTYSIWNAGKKESSVGLLH
jgi:hypothetical protein